MFGNEKMLNGFNNGITLGESNASLTNNAAPSQSLGFVGAEGVKTGISVNGAGATLTMKSEFFFVIPFCDFILAWLIHRNGIGI